MAKRYVKVQSPLAECFWQVPAVLGTVKAVEESQPLCLESWMCGSPYWLLSSKLTRRTESPTSSFLVRTSNSDWQKSRHRSKFVRMLKDSSVSSRLWYSFWQSFQQLFHAFSWASGVPELLKTRSRWIELRLASVLHIFQHCSKAVSRALISGSSIVAGVTNRSPKRESVSASVSPSWLSGITRSSCQY